MKKCLILGGAGFIGSHLSEKLSGLGFELAIADNFSSDIIIQKNNAFKIHQIDIDNPQDLKKVFDEEKPDFVFHLAGVINLRKNIDDPLFRKDFNFLSRTDTILNICSLANVKKLIFISSGGAVYENAEKIPTSEEYLAHPDSIYGLANLIIEKYIKLYCDKNILSFTILRLANVYGPRQWISGIVPSLIASHLEGKNQVIYGNGLQTRDFIYIDDAVSAIISSIESGDNGIYNVGTGQEISIKKIFGLIGEITGSKISMEFKDSKTGGTERSALDIRKIKKEFGWNPKNSIKEGLVKTVEWYAKQKN